MRRLAVAGMAVATLLGGACGKKGAPLPPLVLVPEAPAGFVAARRAGIVDLQFTVPGANTDGTRPANVERVDVYGFTGPQTVSDDVLLTRGAKIGSVPVKAPRNPNAATDPEDEEEGAEEPEFEDSGLDQGATARLQEPLTAAALTPAPADSNDGELPVRDVRPLLGPPDAVPSRTYVGVSISTSGRRGPFSARAVVPLVPPPPAPSPPVIDYDEKALTITWGAAESGALPQEEASSDLLPARLIGPAPPSIAYNVYEVPSATAAASTETRLTKTPVSEPQLTDARIAWGVERCYVVRTVAMFDTLPLESAPSSATCRKLVDTFPPAAPKGLTVVGAPGTISLIWQPNTEKDVAGYVVLRGVAPETTLARVTPDAIRESTFRDAVSPGVRYVYRVQAIDAAGNVSEPSAPVEELAR